MRALTTSKTAFRTAISRAAHQLMDQPKILDDPIALRVVGDEGLAMIERGGHQFRSRFSKRLRAFLVIRSKVAEDALSNAIQRGVGQYVVLGAGLDTFAYRNPYPNLRVFEVDHPNTQTAKQAQLKAAGISIPSNLTYVAVDFEREALLDRLAEAGFRPDRPTFFSWLGVSMYLNDDTVRTVLGTIAPSAAGGGGIVFDYISPTSKLGFASRVLLFVLHCWLKSIGEPFRSRFMPDDISETLRTLGFETVNDMGADEINRRYFNDRIDDLQVGGPARLVAATA
jgi:methyltransferase (TIGR00027 family)